MSQFDDHFLFLYISFQLFAPVNRKVFQLKTFQQKEYPRHLFIVSAHINGKTLIFASCYFIATDWLVWLTVSRLIFFTIHMIKFLRRKKPHPFGLYFFKQ